MHDFVGNVELYLLPTLTRLNPEQYKVTERLFVVLKGRFILAVKSTNTVQEILYRLGPGDVSGIIDPIGDISLKGFNEPIKAFEIRWNI